ncbi:hypothetical protein [Clostridium oryzae]|uniref:TrbC/VIRB2 family protein n=1 Tax=Clostridium oryzae TaxID=1450648 RepID=A0A1V4IIU1_9CLOT|nr:hypothetical protein [Clostridium oryzae]OPJ59760.1 hypothetical protein CLORY_31050 [Clostridium oryzae]
MLQKLKMNSTFIRILFITTIFIMIFSVNAFAGDKDKNDKDTGSGSTVVTTQSANQVATKAINSMKPILLSFGGVCVFAGVAMIGFKLIFAHNNPDKRISAMSGLLYIGIGAFMLGGCMMVAGFFWGLGQ